MTDIHQNMSVYFFEEIFIRKSQSESSRGGLGGKATTMFKPSFKHSCHFSPGGSNPA